MLQARPQSLPARPANAADPQAARARRVLAVGPASKRAEKALAVADLEPEDAPDPFAAMRELVSRPPAFRALLLSLDDLYPDELDIILCVKRLYPHVEVMLVDVEGHGENLARAVRMGADTLVVGGRLNRLSESVREPAAPLPAPTAVPAGPINPAMTLPPRPLPAPASDADEGPVLTAEELDALLGADLADKPA